jgi:formate hydrogenlyase subunit 3/multisubunit Na+/H+ antiporter MnhD subunit
VLILLLTGSALWLLVLRKKSVRRLENSCGLARSCPGEAWVLMIAGLSLLGAAPLGGYWQLCLLFGLRGSWHSQALLGLPLLFVLPVTAMSVMDLCGRMFDRPADPEPAPDPPHGALAMALRILIVVLVSVLVLLGLVPQLFLEPVGWLGG